jgi:hypothetical protein
MTVKALANRANLYVSEAADRLLTEFDLRAAEVQPL